MIFGVWNLEKIRHQ